MQVSTWVNYETGVSECVFFFSLHNDRFACFFLLLFLTYGFKCRVRDYIITMKMFIMGEECSESEGRIERVRQTVDGTDSPLFTPGPPAASKCAACSSSSPTLQFIGFFALLCGHIWLYTVRMDFFFLIALRLFFHSTWKPRL